MEHRKVEEAKNLPPELKERSKIFSERFSHRIEEFKIYEVDYIFLSGNRLIHTLLLKE
jgi:hypothetical protein